MSNSLELADQVEDLLFYCGSLSQQLRRVNENLDQVRQCWLKKRQFIDCDTSSSPLIAQKVARCNTILLRVVEKLTAVELHSQSLQQMNTSLNERLLQYEKNVENNSGTHIQHERCSRIVLMPSSWNAMHRCWYDVAYSVDTGGRSSLGFLRRQSG
jgi:hypothetical protein